MEKAVRGDEEGRRVITAKTDFDVLTAGHCWEDTVWMLMIINDEDTGDGEAHSF